MAYLGIVADDLTGATTTGVLLARSGVKTKVYFHEEAVNKTTDASEKDAEGAIVISSNSRAYKPEKAYETVKFATEVLIGQGCRYFQKRIDTTMRGGIGTEIDAMLSVMGENTVAVVVPAMPKSRRILVGGYSIIDGTALVNTPVAKDVRTPVTENYIPRLLETQTKENVALIPLEKVLKGSCAVVEDMREKRANGSRVFVADAITEQDVAVIAEACMKLQWNILSVDPGPFAAELARQRGLAGQEQDGPYSLNVKEKTSVKHGRTVLVAAGSATEVTKRQMQNLFEKTDAHQISVDPVRLLSGAEEAEKEIVKAAEDAVEILKNQSNVPAVVFETALHGTLLDLDAEDKKRGYPNGMSADKINEGLGIIVKKVLDTCGKNRIAGLYMTGGDTMVHVCRKLGTECLEVLDYVIPQTDVSKLADGKYQGMTVIGKGGMTGYDEIAEDIVNALLK